MNETSTWTALRANVVSDAELPSAATLSGLQFPALMPVVGLKVLHLTSSNLGLLFTSMGAGSVAGAVFIIPWLRARLSPDECLGHHDLAGAMAVGGVIWGSAASIGGARYTLLAAAMLFLLILWTPN